MVILLQVKIKGLIILYFCQFIVLGSQIFCHSLLATGTEGKGLEHCYTSSCFELHWKFGRGNCSQKVWI